MNCHKRPTSKGFTLIELMVVVSIVVLLASMLLPSLAAVRKLARTIVCANNLHNIGVGMQRYGQDFDSAIVGNAWTSGSFLKTKHTPVYNDNYCPVVCETWDWSSPIGQELMIGADFDQGSTTTSRGNRFVYLNNYPGFLCPENNIQSIAYSGSAVNAGTVTMLSYNTAVMFQYKYGTGDTTLYQNYINTGNYDPTKMVNVGAPSNKIFLSDGARWTSDDVTPPDYNLTISWIADSSPGGAYADYGPWSAYSRSFLRNAPMVYAMRHGSNKLGDILGAYRFNAVFFDGHVKTLDGQTGMDPNMWLPTGAILPQSELTTEAQQLYMPSAPSLIIN